MSWKANLDWHDSLDSCAHVAVGAGWGGVYFAYRTAVALGPERARSVCVWEASHRLGGRTFSVRGDDLGKGLVLDVGAYRFSPDMHLPGDLILRDLNLPTACYEPGCLDAAKDFPPPFLFNYSAPLRRIIDPVTLLPAGYSTAIEEMVRRLTKMGARVFRNFPLTDVLHSGENGTLVQVQGNRTVRITGSLLLNLPRNKLLALPSVAGAAGKKSMLDQRTLSMLKCTKFDAPPSLFHNQTDIERVATALSKAYLYYEDAWWHTRVNLTVGQFPHNAFLPVTTSLGVNIGIHWNDGPVVCKSGEGLLFNPTARRRSGALPPGTKCRGYLQIFYAVSNETFYFSKSGAPRQPLGVVEDIPPYGNKQLGIAHAALIEAIRPLLEAHGVAPSELSSPTQLVVGVWSRPDVLRNDHGYTAPTKIYWAPSMSGSLANACGIDGLTEGEYRSTVLQPFGEKAPIFLANNDFVAQNVDYFFGDWAEESLLQSERALFRLGNVKPAWLNSSYYDTKVKSLAR